jgi:hypothetical protein
MVFVEPIIIINQGTTVFICFQSLMSLLLAQHTNLKEQILEVLDADLIRQQAEKGILDFQVSDET